MGLLKMKLNVSSLKIKHGAPVLPGDIYQQRSGKDGEVLLVVATDVATAYCLCFNEQGVILGTCGAYLADLAHLRRIGFADISQITIHSAGATR